MRWLNPSQKIKARKYFSKEVNKMKGQTEEAFSVGGVANKDDFFS